MTISRISTRRCAAAVISFLVAASWLLTSTPVIGANRGAVTPGGPFEIYVTFGNAAAWMGNTISYTVYEPTVVEARLLSGSGEIILIFRQGEQQPGQYTLPWDGTYEGAPFAGLYTFELYFGDEYAAKLPIVVNPLPTSS